MTLRPDEKIVNKNKFKIAAVKVTRTAPSIATEDRPYSPNDPRLNLDNSGEKEADSPTLTSANGADKEEKVDGSSIVEHENQKPVQELETKIEGDSPPSPVNQQSEDKNMSNENNEPAQTTSVPTANYPFLNVDVNETREIYRKPHTNQTQTQHEINTNQTQKPNTNSTQTKHRKNKPDTNQTQTQHKSDTQPNTGKTQTKHKVDTNRTQSQRLKRISKVQREILLFLFDECKTARSNVTPGLAVSDIANGAKVAKGSVKTSIIRMCKEGILSLGINKAGRGGWTEYEIPDEVYKELLLWETKHKLHTNQTQTQHKSDTQPNTQPDTSASSSSSSLILKETTTEFSDEWNFDIAPYARFGFTKSQIKQLMPLGTISPADVEQSLIEFSYDFDNDSLPPIKTTKTNFLMWLFREGHVYTSESFRTEQQAIIAEMARRVEEKNKKFHEEQQILFEDSFNDWYSSLADDAKKKLTEGKVDLTLGPNGQEITRKSLLKEHFTNNIWMDVKPQ